MARWLMGLLVPVLLFGCTDETPGDDAAKLRAAQRAAILDVAEAVSWELPGLTADVEIVYTEMGVPHLYAKDRLDLARALGFVVARDRFFVMDLQRRLGLGTVSALLGDIGLDSDMDARLTGMRYVSERVAAGLDDDLAAYLDAYVEGINRYIELVASGDALPPSELAVAGPFLGAPDPATLMKPFDRLSVAAMVAVVMYQTNYESSDVRRSYKQSQGLAGLAGAPFEDLRIAGYLQDLWNDLRPAYGVRSTEGTSGAANKPKPQPDRGWAQASPRRPVPTLRRADGLMKRAADRLARMERRLGRTDRDSQGSNTWAVAGSHSRDGEALVAGDGHLPLTVPALMYSVGLDTEVFGGGGLQQAGLLITSLPLLAVGTNGQIAWSQVNPVADITDWYREELKLGDDGLPAASRFAGDWKELEAVEEVYDIADLPALGSVGRTEKWSRWTTFDGRFLFDIEGEEVGELPEGASDVVNLGGRLVRPGDVDGDGVVHGISFDYTAFDTTAYVKALDEFGHAKDVRGYQEASKGLIGNMLYAAVADQQGDILFTSYQGVPCRGYLERTDDGRWAEGADPTMVLDGTRYGGFSIVSDAQGKVVEGESDPYRCAIPFDATPQVISPPTGYVVNANNQPAPFQEDGRLDNDAIYMGGPWSSVRADSIAGAVRMAIDEGVADVDKMAEIQGFRRSRLGELFVPHLLDAIAAAKAGGSEPHQQRLGAIYTANSAAIDEVATRFAAWQTAGFDTPSGVATFYETPGEGDGEAAVATMIFNAWLPRALRGTFDDEGIGDGWRYSADRIRFRALDRFLRGRGDGHGGDLGSWNEATGESIFFDRRQTEEVERSEEILLQALSEALEFLASESTGPGQGGFGTEDMEKWLWGLRHQTRFESLLAEFLDADSDFGFLMDLFSITTETLPLSSDFDGADPRRGLKWFPRGGDQYAVDAGNPGFSGTGFTHGSGPVMRMVIALKDGKVWGQNILPGGQSGVKESAHFSDQAAYWLGNDTVPLRYHPEDVIDGATGRERLTPAK